MIRYLAGVLIWSTYLVQISGQVKMDFMIQEATCNNNGSVMILATGGTAPYNYEIVGNTCGLSNRSIQASPVFNNLSACTYTFWVMDASGQFTTLDATVGGNYIGPSASVSVNGCSFMVEGKNGRSPLKYSFSTDGGRNYGPPSAQNTFTGLANGTYFVKIEDTCQSVFITSATVSLDTLEYFFNRVYSSRLTDSITPFMITGGQGPFKFFIVNGLDTLRSENNVFALKDIIKTCSTQVVIQSACGNYINPFTYTDAELVCLNPSQGTAEIKVNTGVPPFKSYYYPASGSSLAFEGLLLSGLPVNDSYYYFSVLDQCGHYSNGSYESLYRNTDDLIFKTSNSCADYESVRLDIVQNNFWVKNKYTLECTSCIPVQRFTNIEQSVTVTNLNTGKKTFVISDSCGTRWTCRSEYYIPVQERCDSIRVLLVNAFSCDNQLSGMSFSGDTVLAEMYYLLNENGILLDSNSQGIFTALTNGVYRIQVKSPGCDLIETTYTRNLVVVAPNFRIGMTKRNEQCNTTYFLNIDYTYFPYSLTDQSGNQLASTVSPNTDFGISFNNIAPGKYSLKSLLNCWEKEIDFPEIYPKIKQENITVCPAGGSITISGGRSFAQWQEYYKSLGLTLNYTSQEADWYSLDSRQSRFNYDTATHTFFNIEPGKTFTVYLHSFASVNYIDRPNTCPVDSLTITMPSYIPPALVADLVTECDEARSALFQLKIKNGSGPFQIQELDCGNPLNIGNSYTAIDSLFEIYNPAYTPGIHCFKVTDVCQNSTQAEAASNEQLLQIQSQKNCDSTSSFSYSKIAGASYAWSVNGKPHPVDSFTISITDPRPGDEINVQIVYKGCTIQKSLKADSLTLKKMDVRIESDKPFDLCAGDSILLNAVITGGIEPLIYTWGNGDSSPQQWVKNAGIQTLNVRNGIGCEDSTQVNIRIGTPLQWSSIQNNVLCYGDSSGSIKIIPRGGIEPYRMSWSNGAILDSIVKLRAGNYQFTLTDFAGCTLSSIYNVTQNNPLVNQSTIVRPPTCGVSSDGSITLTTAGGVGPYQYRWDSGQTTNQINGLNPGVYLVTVTDRYFCPYMANIGVQAGPQILSRRTDTLCAGAHLRVGNSIYTVSGNFRDTLKTHQGCDSVVLTALTINPPLQFSLSGVSPSCFGQTNGTVSISGLNSKPPYSFSLNGKSYTGFVADQLSPGNYIAKITDGLGCFTEKGVSLSNPKRMELEAGRDSLIRLGDSVFFEVTTNLNPAEIKNIRWNSDQGLICHNCSSARLKPKKDQNIMVTLENLSGCKITDQFTLKVDINFKVFAPNILYINESGNNQNSRFTLFSDQQIVEIEFLRIYNRYGAIVFETRNIQPGDLSAGWDGRINTQFAESGVYVYLARIRLADESVQTKSGDITVIR